MPLEPTSLAGRVIVLSRAAERLQESYDDLAAHVLFIAVEGIESAVSARSDYAPLAYGEREKLNNALLHLHEAREECHYCNYDVVVRHLDAARDALPR